MSTLSFACAQTNSNEEIEFKSQSWISYRINEVASVLITAKHKIQLNQTKIWITVNESAFENALELNSFTQHTQNSIGFKIKVINDDATMKNNFVDFIINVQINASPIFQEKMYLTQQPKLKIQKKSGNDGPLDKGKSVTYGASITYPWGGYLAWNWDLSLQPAWVNLFPNYFDKTITISNNNTDLLDFSDFVLNLSAKYASATDNVEISLINNNGFNKIPFSYINIDKDGKVIDFNSAAASLTTYNLLAIPKNVTSINASIFEKKLNDCSDVSVIFNSNSLCEVIDASAFAGNTHVKKVTFANHLKEIHQNAFADCSELSELHFKTLNPPQFATTPFLNCSSIKKVYIPVGTKDAYLPFKQIFNIQNDGDIVEE
ncbi:MAG: leucine-rich repeat domain-containing protein [Mycoplasmataceae bacterium]|nr:leucine-rich repeat domain-containing protein [Mycoplasmataceae bacterium]